jgi:hypothetical protein
VREPNLGVFMSDGGKGSNPRPFSVDNKTYEDNWDKIFKKNNYQDILKTEDCVLDALEEIKKECKCEVCKCIK